MNYGKIAAKRREAEIDAIGTKLRKKTGVAIGKILLAGMLLLAVVGLSAGLGVWKGIIDSAPDISAIDVVPTGYQTIVLDNAGNQTATLVASGANRKYVTIDEVPLYLQQAFIAIEDERFPYHNGIDPKGIIRALAEDIRSGSASQGASTITQQLIKNSVLGTTWESELNKKTSLIERVQRKLQEQYLAIRLEQQVSKDWILEEYMNTINLGSNTLGVQAASEKYFGKDVSELTLSESAVIAGITKNPSANNPIIYPENNKKRQKLVLDAMLRLGYITQEEFDEALADDVYSRIEYHNAATEHSYNSYFVDAVIDDVFDDLVNDLGWSETEAYKAIYRGGLTIVSTQDQWIQDICDEEANNQEHYPNDVQYSFALAFQVKKADGSVKHYSNQMMLSYYKAKTGNPDYDINYDSIEECDAAIAKYQQDVLEEGDVIVEGSTQVSYTLQPEVAMTVIDQYTGEVKALVGGRGEKSGNRTWNRATDTQRQPGSTFKIIAAYAPALDAGGKTLASVQVDAPYTVGQKTYKNYDDKYRGWTNVRKAITNSINIVTIKTLQDIGVNLGFQYANKFGFTTLCQDDKNLGLCLGGLTKGVTNLELTAAYAAIANSGEYLEPKFYSVVYDHDGNVLLDRTKLQESHRVIKPTTAWLLTSAMEDVMIEGTGKKAYFGPDMAQAGKSGTTTSNRDCLFAGYTPYYTMVVWGGYDDNSAQNSGETSYPRYIWKNAMARIHEGLEYKEFVQPSGIGMSEVCRESGLLPMDHICENDVRGTTVYSEYFDVNTLPTTVCETHVYVDICEESGAVAGEFCPAEQVITKLMVAGSSFECDEAEIAYTEEMALTPCPLHTEPVVEENPDGMDGENVDPGMGDNTGTGTETGTTEPETVRPPSNRVEDIPGDGIIQHNPVP